jgi:phosphohistidine phosphatase SixA
MIRAILLLFALATPAFADWQAARTPGAVILFRHAIAPGTGDPADFRLGDCTTQRNLSDQGRAQARAIGQALRDADVRPAQVLTSQWCRARETAELLGFGQPEDLPALNSFFADRAEGPAQTDSLRGIIAALPEGQTVVMVTHQVNITALTGVTPASGEGVVLVGGQVAGRLPPP